MDKVIPKQSEGNGGEVRPAEFLYSNPGVKPLVKESDFSQKVSNEKFIPGRNN